MHSPFSYNWRQSCASDRSRDCVPDEPTKQRHARIGPDSRHSKVRAFWPIRSFINSFIFRQCQNRQNHMHMTVLMSFSELCHEVKVRKKSHSFSLKAFLTHLHALSFPLAGLQWTAYFERSLMPPREKHCSNSLSTSAEVGAFQHRAPSLLIPCFHQCFGRWWIPSSRVTIQHYRIYITSVFWLCVKYEIKHSINLPNTRRRLKDWDLADCDMQRVHGRFRRQSTRSLACSHVLDTDDILLPVGLPRCQILWKYTTLSKTATKNDLPFLASSIGEVSVTVPMHVHPWVSK